MIVVVDYGMGNLRSVGKAFERLGANILITSDIHIIEKADKIILPGVGHFKYGMERLTSMNFIDLLDFKVLSEERPILGVCLGMQLMTRSSEEGNVPGLSWIDAYTKKFLISSKNSIFKVPHMGWNSLTLMKKSDLFENLSSEDQFYFVHSYYVSCNNQEDVLFRTEYGIVFDSGFAHNNIFGVQFHPEKSHKPGLKLLKNFIEL